MDQVDFRKPLHVGCGTLLPVRSSALAAIYHYDYDPATSPRRVDDKIFELNCLLITTRGYWQIRGIRGRADIDALSMPVGVLGDTYGCRHYSGGNSSYVVTLSPRALDPDYGRIFAKPVIPSRDALRVVLRAARAASDDAFDSLIFTLFDEASFVSTRQSEAGISRLRMQRAKRFIEFHAFEQLRLEDIASDIGLSPFTALRQFRSATGTTPHAYLLEIRLLRAKQLLETTGDSIQEIASKVGFGDLAYFSRFFKSRTGLSPSSYRAERVDSCKGGMLTGVWFGEQDSPNASAYDRREPLRL
ncbi:MAG TPA: AraC family transcriptional regulator [Candidatus Baltobacteraceae bacterium]|jgi:AraC-like DNA-binding protein